MEILESSALALLKYFVGKRDDETEAFGVPLQLHKFANLKNMAQRLFVADAAHALLLESQTGTHRSLYYRSLTANAGLFASQVALNIQVHALGDAVNLDTRDLGIFSTAKGLIATGDVATFLTSGDIAVTVSEHPDGLVISDSISRFSKLSTGVTNVIILEKDSIFQHIVSNRDFMLSSRSLLVTAKGYPDRSTVTFVKGIFDSFPALKFYYIGDLDPHGISIYLDYYKKIVSRDLEQLERTFKWLGINADDVKKVQAVIPEGQTAGLKMKDKDLSLLRSLTEKSEVLQKLNLDAEIDLLNKTKLKYEVECLHTLGELYVFRWLTSKLE